MNRLSEQHINFSGDMTLYWYQRKPVDNNGVFAIARSVATITSILLLSIYFIGCSKGINPQWILILALLSAGTALCLNLKLQLAGEPVTVEFDGILDFSWCPQDKQIYIIIEGRDERISVFDKYGYFELTTDGSNGIYLEGNINRFFYHAIHNNPHSMCKQPAKIKDFTVRLQLSRTEYQNIYPKIST